NLRLQILDFLSLLALLHIHIRASLEQKQGLAYLLPMFLSNHSSQFAHQETACYLLLKELQ
ncbi:hypothetical protein S83_062464, partial [Arachis hypogaea]